MVTTRRHNVKARVRTAANRDGRLLARDVQAWFDTGAYADNGPRVTATGGDAAPGPYRWSAVRVQADCVYTNTAPSGSYRAFGASHLQWAGELQVDEVARRAGLIRSRSDDATCSDRGSRYYRRQAARRRPHRRCREGRRCARLEPERIDGTGRGVAVGLLAAGAHPVSSAIVRLEADGTAVVLVGSTELGQGQRTAFAQIAGEVLAMPAERVTCQGTTPSSRRTIAPRVPVARRRSRVWRSSAPRMRCARTSSTSPRRSGPTTSRRTSCATEPPGAARNSLLSGVDREALGLSGGQLIGEGGVHPKAPDHTPRGRSSGRCASAPQKLPWIARPAS